MQVAAANGNLIDNSRLLPDIEVEIKGLKWVIDLAFAVDNGADNAYQNKINKYS
jgi:hypothetical protein